MTEAHSNHRHNTEAPCLCGPLRNTYPRDGSRASLYGSPGSFPCHATGHLTAHRTYAGPSSRGFFHHMRIQYQSNISNETGNYRVTADPAHPIAYFQLPSDQGTASRSPQPAKHKKRRRTCEKKGHQRDPAGLENNPIRSSVRASGPREGHDQGGGINVLPNPWPCQAGLPGWGLCLGRANLSCGD
jgi:hypothetical protein